MESARILIESNSIVSMCQALLLISSLCTAIHLASQEKTIRQVLLSSPFTEEKARARKSEVISTTRVRMQSQEPVCLQGGSFQPLYCPLTSTPAPPYPGEWTLPPTNFHSYFCPVWPLVTISACTIFLPKAIIFRWNLSVTAASVIWHLPDHPYFLSLSLSLNVWFLKSSITKMELELKWQYFKPENCIFYLFSEGSERSKCPEVFFSKLHLFINPWIRQFNKLQRLPRPS